MNKNLVIFSDYGLDDAVALIYLLDNNQYKHIDIVAIAGNTTAEASLSNLQKLLAHYFKTDGAVVRTKQEAKKEAERKKNLQHSITIVDTVGIKQNFCELPPIHGADGMGDLYIDGISACKVIKYDAYMGITKDEQGRCKDAFDPSVHYDIASFGPATLVKPFVERLTETKQSRVLLMGHLVSEEPNYEGEEFNYKLDELAFEWCLEHTDNVVATLDTCRNQFFNLAKAKLQTSSPVFDDLLGKAIELAVARHPDNAYVYDYIAARYLVEHGAFDIVPSKTKRGNTIQQLLHKSK
ncbi:MAG: nucleoside hydrolase [Firmicutes bacterium]|nr:nucleoside hydrolase [Bacillota bacterium]